MKELKEKKNMKKLSDKEIKEVSGGKDIPYGSLHSLESVKYACPKCGSWEVFNYDPGVFYEMRVACTECGFYGTRKGEANTISDEDRQFLVHKEDTRKIPTGPWIKG